MMPGARAGLVWCGVDWSASSIVAGPGPDTSCAPGYLCAACVPLHHSLSSSSRIHSLSGCCGDPDTSKGSPIVTETYSLLKEGVYKSLHLKYHHQLAILKIFANQTPISGKRLCLNAHFY